MTAADGTFLQLEKRVTIRHCARIHLHMELGLHLVCECGDTLPEETCFQATPCSTRTHGRKQQGSTLHPVVKVKIINIPLITLHCSRVCELSSYGYDT